MKQCKSRRICCGKAAQTINRLTTGGLKHLHLAHVLTMYHSAPCPVPSAARLAGHFPPWKALIHPRRDLPYGIVCALLTHTALRFTTLVCSPEEISYADFSARTLMRLYPCLLLNGNRNPSKYLFVSGGYISALMPKFFPNLL